MVSPPKIGDVVKIRAWHGVVLDVFRGDTGKTILRVQTVRNVFRRLNPEFIEFDLAPDTISLASTEDLQTEIERYKKVLDTTLHELIESTGEGASG
jgi:hypothetical protein